jgi:hypothetical protein
MSQKNFDEEEFRLMILSSLDKNFCHPLWYLVIDAYVDVPLWWFYV